MAQTVTIWQQLIFFCLNFEHANDPPKCSNVLKLWVLKIWALWRIGESRTSYSNPIQIYSNVRNSNFEFSRTSKNFQNSALFRSTELLPSPRSTTDSCPNTSVWSTLCDERNFERSAKVTDWYSIEPEESRPLGELPKEHEEWLSVSADPRSTRRWAFGNCELQSLKRDSWEIICRNDSRSLQVAISGNSPDYSMMKLFIEMLNRTQSHTS